ncbi:DUF3427 domain-containing protein [Isobaculum melis]|uniref:Helicase conserved C-terminal domain-containing protein n=1 Tax=Isobaculum melis TaxID=142588 RepID=A0A1H9U067_9LACT|nr:DUF3427 domain-containing protein [Isobaculum melis]SES02759.1 Helicase conserved C-terminal domain-containing protein [Isobaculum melis]
MYSLIENSTKESLHKELLKSFEGCTKFYFNVAFITISGIQLLLEVLEKTEKDGIAGQILTGTYLNFTEPRAIERVNQFSNIDLRIFETDKQQGFHPKAYIFEYPDSYKVVIGSSNITHSALLSNIEWNVRVVSKKGTEENTLFIEKILASFNELWSNSIVVTDHFLESYTENYIYVKKKENIVFSYSANKKINPNNMQQTGLDNLADLRDAGETKALIIAATGTGKTYLSAFDVENFKPKKMLFLVHQSSILVNAKATFDRVDAFKHKTTGRFFGDYKEINADYIFSTISMMEKHYMKFSEDHFDYIIVDEAHHATSPTFQKVLNYFSPQFLLGMTATPERCDDDNIFEIFDDNIACSIRLNEAMEKGMLTPFHYFGITDVEGIDISDQKLTVDQLAQKLAVNKRVNFILEKLSYYGYDGEYLKALGFCVNKEHARYMAEEFNKRGIPSVTLFGEDDVHTREKRIKELEDDDHPLQVIFTVDIFNEGVDIPSINMILMLRPTSSPIVFTQQLGRGLRKYKDKEFLTVLDFIGNHQKSFLIAIALSGGNYNKESLKEAVLNDFQDYAGENYIYLDEIAKEQILNQISNENFSSKKYLKELYREYKRTRNGKIPYKLISYLGEELAPDPMNFLEYDSKVKNYLQFLQKVETEDSFLEQAINDEILMIILSQLTSYLPLKRVYEFAVINYLMKSEFISLEQGIHEVKKFVNYADVPTLKHSFRNLNQEFQDDDKKYIGINTRLFILDEENMVLKRTDFFSNKLEDDATLSYIEDVVKYGLMRYQEAFGRDYYNVPHLKLYAEYAMTDLATLSNSFKKKSSFRGAGVLRSKELNTYYFFVDLHKEPGIDERINYKDKFINQKQFQWESPNNTSLDSERGKDFIDNVARGQKIHLFVRKFKKVDGLTMKYLYLGEISSIVGTHVGEKPIQIQYELQNELPYQIYDSFEPDLNNQ